ncbi:MAG: SURF1 family protein, partial [Proteobacteria bacterium]
MTATAAKRRGGIALCLLAFALFSGLGVWQVERLAWKRDLIARVDARTLADPVDLASA